MNQTDLRKHPTGYTAYLIFLSLGMPVISILGMLSNVSPSLAWSWLAIPVAFATILPILPRGIKVARNKMVGCSIAKKALCALVVLSSLLIITFFSYVALTRAIPIAIMPLTGTLYEMEMTIEKVEGGGRKVCSSGTRISIADATTQLRTSMCMGRNARDHFQAGQQVMVRGYDSWFAYTFNEMWPIRKTPSKGSDEKRSPIFLKKDKSNYLGIE